MTRSALAIVLGVVLAACSGGVDRSPRVVVVSAASSLTDAFTEIETAFESANPGVDVVVNFAGTSALREQVLEGAPVDVLAAADVETIDELVAAGAVQGASVFAINRMVIAVPTGNPAGVTGLADFARDDLLLGLCAEGVPCGDLARDVLTITGVEPVVDTNEPNVRALLAKVEAGELDAAITYTTDVLAREGTVEGVEIPPGVDVAATYSIAAVTDGPDGGDAAAFIAFVMSPAGLAILVANGFETP